MCKNPNEMVKKIKVSIDQNFKYFFQNGFRL